MTNKEKYKQAFSVIRVSDDFTLETKNIGRTAKHYRLKPVAAIIAACIILVGTATTAYAADIGGIQRIIQIWLHGDKTSATITFHGNGTYDMDYTDSEGNPRHRHGGGTGINADGSERPMTEDELIEGLSHPDIQYNDDGTVWVYWYDQVHEITDMFEDGVCFLKLEKEDETLYLTVKYKNGSAGHPDRFIMPDRFEIIRGG